MHIFHMATVVHTCAPRQRTFELYLTIFFPGKTSVRNNPNPKFKYKDIAEGIPSNISHKTRCSLRQCKKIKQRPRQSAAAKYLLQCLDEV